MAIEAGMSHTCETMVDQHNVAKSVGSGRVDVFFAPMMILLIEQAEISAQMKTPCGLAGCFCACGHSAPTRSGLPAGIKKPYHRYNTKL